MDVAAKMTSKGQITVPKAVRDALGLAEGDHVIFRVEGNHVTFARTLDFLDLAGSISVPDDVRGAAWDDIVAATWADRATSIG